MNIRAKTLLYDVLESRRCIRDWCVGHSFTDYEANRQFRRAVEREFEIIGEALNRLRSVAPATANRVPELDRIVRICHKITFTFCSVVLCCWYGDRVDKKAL
jgi:uncharacterized protein with HEPN domain